MSPEFKRGGDKENGKESGKEEIPQAWQIRIAFYENQTC